MAEQEVRSRLICGSSDSKDRLWLLHIRFDSLIQVTQASIGARLDEISKKLTDGTMTASQYLDKANILQAQLNAFIPSQ